MNADSAEINSLTEKVLGAVFEVSNMLGAGFLEKVYQRALLLDLELGLRGIRAIAEASFAISYKGHSVGEYFADLPIENVVVVELKCADRLSNEHTAQFSIICEPPAGPCVFSSIFQKPKVEWKRIVHGFPIPDPTEGAGGAGKQE